MNTTDDQIRAALQEQIASAASEPADDATLREMIADSFRRRGRWIVIMAWIELCTFFALSVFCAWKFFHVTETRDLILWSVSFLLVALGTVMLKLWYWMLLNRNTVLREVKRLELQIAQLIASTGR